jgi:hypothetical protein
MKIVVYDDQPFRTKRIEKALRIASAVLSITPEQADLLIAEIEDRRGDLIVKWNTWPITELQRHAFDTAWRECGEHVVEHINIAEDVFL